MSAVAHISSDPLDLRRTGLRWEVFGTVILGATLTLIVSLR
jgi:hypothetical protein